MALVHPSTKQLEYFLKSGMEYGIDKNDLIFRIFINKDYVVERNKIILEYKSKKNKSNQHLLWSIPLILRIKNTFLKGKIISLGDIIDIKPLEQPISYNLRLLEPFSRDDYYEWLGIYFTQDGNISSVDSSSNYVRRDIEEAGLISDYYRWEKYINKILSYYKEGIQDIG